MIDSVPVKGILLDLDNTLYHYQMAHEPAIAAAIDFLAARVGQDHGEVEGEYFAARQRVNKSLSGLAASHSRLLYFQGVCERYGHLPCEFALIAEELYWKVFFDNMILREGVLAFFERVDNLSLCIVTDLTARVQFEKILKLKLSPYIDAIVTSEECGHEKPHAAIFEMAAAKLKMPYEELCMVGDSYERDIVGATAIGIKSFWYCDSLENSDDNGQTNSVAPVETANQLVVRFSRFDELSAHVLGVAAGG